MSQQPLDFDKHCQMLTGAYVQANTKTNNTKCGSSNWCTIYLCPTPNSKQGGHDLMDLNSGRKIQHAIVNKVPVTAAVIRAVEHMAEKQGFKELKFCNCHGVTFHDTELDCRSGLPQWPKPKQQRRWQRIPRRQPQRRIRRQGNGRWQKLYKKKSTIY